MKRLLASLAVAALLVTALAGVSWAKDVVTLPYGTSLEQLWTSSYMIAATDKTSRAVNVAGADQLGFIIKFGRTSTTDSTDFDVYIEVSADGTNWDRPQAAVNSYLSVVAGRGTALTDSTRSFNVGISQEVLGDSLNAMPWARVVIDATAATGDSTLITECDLVTWQEDGAQ